MIVSGIFFNYISTIIRYNMLLIHRILMQLISYDCTLSNLQINNVNYYMNVNFIKMLFNGLMHSTYINTHPIYRLSKAGTALVNTIPVLYYYYYYYYYCYYYYYYFKLSLCLQVRIVVKLRITIIWAISYLFCAITHFLHFLVTFILSESPRLFNL